MTPVQFKNVVELCKGNTPSKIKMLLSFYRQSDIEYIANELHVDKTGDVKDKIATKLASM